MFLNFREISEKVKFQQVLDEFSIPYTRTNLNELKGQGFIISVAKNKYKNPIGTDFGSVINFVSAQRDMSIRDAAQLLHKTFIQPLPTPKRELPEYTLHYCDWLKSQGIDEDAAKEYEVGLSKDKGFTAGKILFKIRDINGEKVGYAMYSIKENDFRYYSGYAHNHVYNAHRVKGKATLVSSPLDVLKLRGDTIALTRASLTDEQAKVLTENYDCLQIATPNPQNIISRLVNHVFVKAI